ncbi:hypothetical protein TNCV_498651 [Trichonephila clavipes]|nr:hypothetical protein TNCV_498651 [Trichonephila clavipes]
MNETTQLNRRKPLNSAEGTKNSPRQEKTIQLGNMNETTQTQQEKTTQLDRRNETTRLCAACNHLHRLQPPATTCNRLHRLYSRIGFSYLLMSDRIVNLHHSRIHLI